MADEGGQCRNSPCGIRSEVPLGVPIQLHSRPVTRKPRTSVVLCTTRSKTESSPPPAYKNPKPLKRPPLAARSIFPGPKPPSHPPIPHLHYQRRPKLTYPPRVKEILSSELTLKMTSSRESSNFRAYGFYRHSTRLECV